MMEQKIKEAKIILKRKRKLYAGSLIFSIFYFICLKDIWSDFKGDILFLVLGIVSVLNLVSYLKDKPENYIWTDEDDVQ